jgi:hypothetical protein
VVTGGLVRTAGPQTYGDIVLLGADTTFVAGGGAIAFASSLDSAQGSPAASLTANTMGLTTFGGTVGGASPLASITTDPGGGTVVGSAVTTTGDQIYGDTLTLSGHSALSGAASTFAAIEGAGFDLTLSFSGTTSLDGGAAGVRNLTSGAGGLTRLGGTLTTTGTQAYNDDVLVVAATVLNTGAGNITFAGTIDGANALTLNSTGLTALGGVVGGTTPLASLATNAGGSTIISTPTVSTSGSQTYRDAVTIGANATLTSSAANVTFSTTVDADAAANNRTLTVNAPVGTVTFSGDVGASQAFADLDVTAGPNTIVFNAASPQSINVTAGSGNTVTFNGPVLLVQDVTLDTAGGGSNNVTFGGAINASASGTRTFVVDAGTGAVLFELVGNVAPLAALNTTGGVVMFNANAIGTQLTITANEVFTGTSGMITATLPFAGFGGPAALTLQGNGTAGIFGTEAAPLNVDVPGLLVVSPNSDRSLPIVWLQGDPARKPFYQFYESSNHRGVAYNGPLPELGAPRSGDTNDALRQEQQRFASELTENLADASAGANLAADVDRDAARTPELCEATSVDSASGLSCGGRRER